MKTNFDFMMPSVNFFGPGVIEKIGDRANMLHMKKALIVTDRFLRNMENGPVKQTETSLQAAGVDYVIFDGVEPNPKIRNVHAGAAMYREAGCDSIITVGVALPMIAGKESVFSYPMAKI